MRDFVGTSPVTIFGKHALNKIQVFILLMGCYDKTYASKQLG